MNPAALAKVQTLYGLQIDLWNVIGGNFRSPEKVKEAQKQVRQFEALLKEVDPGYMGGEDVYESLVQMHEQAKTKLKGKTSQLKVKKVEVKKSKK